MLGTYRGATTHCDDHDAGVEVALTGRLTALGERADDEEGDKAGSGVGVVARGQDGVNSCGRDLQHHRWMCTPRRVVGLVGRGGRRARRQRKRKSGWLCHVGENALPILSISDTSPPG
jgi:hypothetical protein